MSKKPESGGLFFDGIVDGGDLSNPAVSRFEPFRQTLGSVDPSRHQEIIDQIASIPRVADLTLGSVDPSWHQEISDLVASLQPRVADPAKTEIQWSRYRTPAEWQSAEFFDFSDATWRRRKKSGSTFRWEDHPDSGHRKVRIALDDLQSLGIVVPEMSQPAG